jgi:hypothetical protein
VSDLIAVKLARFGITGSAIIGHRSLHLPNRMMRWNAA